MIPSNQTQIIQSDEFLDMLNHSLPNAIENEFYESQPYGLQPQTNSDNQQERQWMFGQDDLDIIENSYYVEQFVDKEKYGHLLFAETQVQAPQQIKKEKNSQDSPVLQINHLKSIYERKISSLLVKTSTSPHLSLSPQRVQEKILRKSTAQMDIEALTYPTVQELKMIKNRESARSSRQRKKMYIDLMEVKIKDLQKIISWLEQQSTIQKAKLDECKTFHQKETLLLQFETQIIYDLKYAVEYNQPLQNILDLHHFCTGVASKARQETCASYLKSLIQWTQPITMKYFCDQAEGSSGVFADAQNSELNQIKGELIQHYSLYEQLLDNFSQQYSDLNKQGLKIEAAQREIQVILEPLPYAKQILIANAAQILTEEQSQIVVKVEEILCQRKQVKTS